MFNEEQLKIQGQVQTEMAHMNGTEQWYATILPGVSYTDGVKMIADKCGADWLIDVIVSYQTEKKVRAIDMQVWEMVVTKGPGDSNSGRVTLYDDTTKVLHQDFEFTDFPLPELKLWVIDKVILLPSEY